MRAIRPTALRAAVLGVVAALVVPAAPASADGIRNDQWWIKTLDLTAVHKMTQGEGIKVAVIDTGVDATHPDLTGNVLPGIDFFDEKTKGQKDRNGHGTGMASLIAGHGHGAGNADGILGIAPKAKILPVAVQAENGMIPPKAVAAGILWSLDQGADVINISLTSSNDSDLEKAVERAYDKNVIVVAGVGNRKDVIIGAPANHPGAVAVTGITRTGKLSKEHISAEQTDIAAPGEDIVRAAPGGGYSEATGASDATAIVSGAVALIRAKYPDLNSHDTFKRLLATTKDAGPPGTDVDYGWGTLDLANALTGNPDDRISARNSASGAAASDLAAPRATRSSDEFDAAGIAYIGVQLVGLLLVAASPVVLIVWLVRRRRRAERAAEEAARVPVTSGAPPAAPPDETPWQRP